MAYIIKRIQSGSTNNIWEWDSNEILLDQASQDKTFYELRISYEGTLPTIYTKVDDVVQTTPSLTIIETGVGEYQLPRIQRRGKRFIFKVYGSANTIVNDISIVYRIRSQR
jgi:hypothetical protein